MLPTAAGMTGRGGGGWTLPEGRTGNGVGIGRACGGGGNPCPGAVGPVPIGAGAAARFDPHDRQNFMPGGFSPRQTPQITGNPALGAGVC